MEHVLPFLGIFFKYFKNGCLMLEEGRFWYAHRRLHRIKAVSSPYLLRICSV